MSSINLVTPIPGPKSQEILKRREAALPVACARATDVVVESAKGALVTDVDGNTLLDFAGGIGMMNAGHRPDEVVKAIKDQTDKYIHMCNIVGSYEPYVALAEKLNELTPGDHAKKTILSCSGSEAVENAVKVARAYTKRQAVVVFEGAYHGRTLLTLTMTSKYKLFKNNLGPFAPEIYRLPAPNVYRRPKVMTEEEYLDDCLERFDHAMISQIDPDSIAAIVIEPVQGEAGFIPVPKVFLEKIRKTCDDHGIVMVADEIQSGFGRTGKLYAIEHYGIVPDVITSAKSLGAGTPISATTGRAKIMDSVHLGGMGGTYGGSPIGCAAALAVIDIMSDPAFFKRATEIGNMINDTLNSWKDKYDIIGDVRGLGAMNLVEFVSDRENRTADMTIPLNIIKKAGAEGIILIRAGILSNCIRLMPPLVITDEQLDQGLDILGRAIEAVNAEQ
ncbi:MAG: 4-aminobutyrate--2-oxoglutarate transaminase [Flavobacteriales bacterium]|nr:4-aminobutyrate--2-oxoglutarate transaminase [Flavobacteriales bacterium]